MFLLTGEFLKSGRPSRSSAVESMAEVQCPFCGAAFQIALDTTIPAQQFTTDCEVCCRPFEVTVECELGEVLSVRVS